MRTDDAAWMV